MMKILKNGDIKCSAKMMAELLGFLQGTKGLHHHIIEAECFKPLHLFFAGAKLARRDKSTWYVFGDHHAIRIAHEQLRAANHMRLAAVSLAVVDSCQNKSMQRTWHGMWGTYDSGIKSFKL